jgi:hypothetical protein
MTDTKIKYIYFHLNIEKSMNKSTKIINITINQRNFGDYRIFLSFIAFTEFEAARVSNFYRQFGGGQNFPQTAKTAKRLAVVAQVR